MAIFGNDNTVDQSLGPFGQAFQKAMDFDDPKAQAAQMELNLQKGAMQAAQEGGLDGLRGFYEKNDPVKALELTQKQQQLEAGALDLANARSRNKMEQMQLMQSGMGFVAQLDKVAMSLPAEQRDVFYQKSLDMRRQYDPQAPEKFDPDRALLSVLTADAMREPQKPTELQQNLAFANSLRSQGKGDLADKLEAKLLSSGGTTVNVNTAEGKSDALTKGLITQDLGTLKGYNDTATGMDSMLSNIDTMRKLLASGTPTGVGQESITKLMAGAKALGLPVDESSLANRQAIDAFSKQFNLSLMQFMKGAISDREEEMLATASPQLNKTPEGNKLLMDSLEVSAKRAQMKASFMRDYLEKNQGLSGAEQQWSAYVSKRPVLSQDSNGQITGINKENTSPNSWKPFLDNGYRGSFTPDQEKAIKTMSSNQIQSMYDAAVQSGRKSPGALKDMLDEINTIKGSGNSEAAPIVTSQAQPIMNDLQKLAPSGSKAIISALAQNASILPQFGINNSSRARAFAATLAHETAGFSAMNEKISDAAANRNYGGRMGNNAPGDGARYKGRGYIQLTGKDNYRNYGNKVGVDLVANPELAANPKVALAVAAAYWQDHGLNELADKGNIRAITKRVNGGYNGLRDREKYFNRANNLNLFGPLAYNDSPVNVPYPAAPGSGLTAPNEISSNMGQTLPIQNSQRIVPDLIGPVGQDPNPISTGLA